MRRPTARLVSLAGLLAVVALATSTAWAWADGDPASDVLATQTLFLPEDAALAPTQQHQLAGLLQEAVNSGYQLRVALIASATDLGSVTELWRQPATYARFLGEELSLTYRGTLLVVMPNGFGVFDQGLPVTAAQAALRTVPLATSGPGLGTTALDAVRRLGAASGHSLPLPAAVATRQAHQSDSVSWIAFVAGAVLIALAWAASLRTRPLRAQGENLPVS